MGRAPGGDQAHGRVHGGGAQYDRPSVVGGLFSARLRAILEGRDPEAERTPQEVAIALAAERGENLAVLRGPTPADLERSSRHPEYGMVGLRIVLNAWAAHDLQHTVQAEEAPMQAFIPGTGPFRFRFADHKVRT